MLSAKRNGEPNTAAMPQLKEIEMDFTIEHNIEIPLDSRTFYPWAKMEVGDSVLIFNKKKDTINSSCVRYGLRENKKFTWRSMDGGVRVWRLK
jgi:hypothetical protein